MRSILIAAAGLVRAGGAFLIERQEGEVWRRFDRLSELGEMVTKVDADRQKRGLVSLELEID